MQNETKDLATLSGSALLSQYLDSVHANLDSVINGTQSLDKLKISKLTVELKELRMMIGKTTGNLTTARNLVKWINELIHQLTRPYELRDYTMTCVRKVHQAIDWAILGHFHQKEQVQDSSLIAVLQNVRVLSNRNLIPQKILNMMKGEDVD